MSSSDAAASSSRNLPDPLEDELLEVWMDEDRLAAQRGLNELCARYPEHAKSLHELARKLDVAASACDVAEGISLAPLELSMPESIGPYRVLGELGRGGFGVVYLGEQTEPLQRQVAIKVLLPTLHTGGARVLRRFELERRTLAQMQHPSIANILDAGATQAGEPYFVMEHVAGIPITRYCDEHRLDLDERIALFAQVCGAVQHAHQNGVIHRDLKPGNILVRDQEGGPLAKVIDFGLAKALESDSSERTGLTEEGRFVGTLEYMSPEQALGAPVDTRTDIYALGALLYELLTGELPHDSKSLRGGDWSQTLRILRDVDPPRPSEALARSDSGIAVIAERRRTASAELLRRVRGDLNWIVMTALAKKRERRYATVADLAADLKRHTQHLPVSVGPPSFAYLVRKFARRHRTAVAAAAVIALLLVATTIGSILLFAQILEARDEAESRQRDAEFNAYAAQIAVAKAGHEMRRGSAMRAALLRAPESHRGWEWRFLAAQSDQSREVFPSTCISLHRMTLLDQGETILVAGVEDRGDGELWPRIEARNARDGTLRWARPGERDEIFSLCSSADGSLFAIGYSRPAEVHLHDGATGEPHTWTRSDGIEVAAILRLDSSHATAAFQKRGNHIAVAAGEVARVFELGTGTERSPEGGLVCPRVRGFDGSFVVSIQDLEFAHDDTRLVASLNPGGLVVWDAAEDEPSFSPPDERLTWPRLDVDPQDRWVACACIEERVIRVFELDDGSLAFELRSSRDVTDVAFSPDGEVIVSAHGDGSLSYWDVESRTEIGNSVGHEQAIRAICFHPDGESVVSASEDGTVRLWPKTPDPVGSIRIGAIEKIPPLFATHPEFPLLIRQTETGLRALDLIRGEVVWDHGEGPRWSALHISRSGDLLFSASSAGRLVAWDARSGEAAGTEAQLEGPIYDLASSADGRWLVAASHETLAVFDARSLRPVHRYAAESTWPMPRAAFTTGEDGGTFLLVAHRSIRILDPTNGALLHEADLAGIASDLVIAPDGKSVCLCDEEGRITRHDGATGRLLAVVHPADRSKSFNLLAWSRDGQRLAAADRRTNAIRLFELERNHELLTLYDHGAWCRGLAFGYRDEYLLVANGPGKRAFQIRAWLAPRDTAISIQGPGSTSAQPGR